jgi:ABC-type phosphate transport system substrate-binding protein
MGSGLLLSSLLPARFAGAAEQELAVIVHPSNSIRLTLAELAGIFKSTTRYWSGDRRIVAFNLPANSDGRALFDREVLDLDPEASTRFWIDRRIRGGEPPPRTVPEPALVLRLVQKLDTAIGYVPAELVSGVREVVRIRAGRASVSLDFAWSKLA